MSPSPDLPIVVIGGGIAGLAAAWRIWQAGRRVLVLEAQPTVGGRIATDRYLHAGESFHIEVGAQFLTRAYPNALRLLREMGLYDALVPLPARVGLVREGQLYQLGSDLRTPFARNLSWESKLRLNKVLAKAMRHWPRLDMHDFERSWPLDTRSVADYAREELNEETLEYLLEPILSSIFYWEPERTSQAILFLYTSALFERGGAGLRLLGLREGMQALPQLLAARLPVQCGVRVGSVEPSGRGEWLISAMLAGQPLLLRAGDVVCATPAPQVSALFPTLRPTQRRFFEGVRYSATVSAAFGLRRRLPTELISIAFPRRESATLASAVVQSVRNRHQLPPGRDVLLLHASGPAATRLLEAEDSTIQSALLAEWQRLVPEYPLSESDLLFVRSYRWPHALPEFNVGHLRALHEMAAGGWERGIAFAGDYLGGPFVEGAITSGLRAAERLLGRDKTGRHAH